MESISYRLLHKKDGTYVLQREMTYITVDEKGNRTYSTGWEDIPTVEEE